MSSSEWKGLGQLAIFGTKSEYKHNKSNVDRCNTKGYEEMKGPSTHLSELGSGEGSRESTEA